MTDQEKHLQKMRFFGLHFGQECIVDNTHIRRAKPLDGVRLCDKFSAHDLRRSAATMLFGDLQQPKQVVMEILGHSKESTFNKYIFLSEKQVSAAAISRLKTLPSVLTG